MQVSFGSFSKKRNSTKRPTTELSDTRDVKLKQATSLDAPTFILTGNDFNWNYAKYGNRYYFITDIRSVHDNLSEVDCILDPLATAKDYILTSTQYVCYSSHNTSTWLADTRVPLLKSTTVQSDTALTGILSNIGCYILSVVGENCVSTYMLQAESQITALLDDIANWDTQEIADIMQGVTFSPASYSQPSPTLPTTNDNFACFSALITSIGDFIGSIGAVSTAIQDSYEQLNKKIQEASSKVGFIGNAYANAPSCIRSCIWVPFDSALMVAGSGGSPIKLGRFQTSVNAPAISSKPSTGSFTINIPWQHSDWRRATCEDVYLYLPLVGMCQLSGDSLTNVSSLTVEWSVTFTDGCICYKVKAGSSVIGSFGANASVNYPIGIAQQASAGEVFTALLQGAQKTVSAAVNSSLSPLSAGASIGEMALDIAITGYDVANAQNTSHVSSVGGIGGGAGLGLGRDAVCFTVNHETVITPSVMKDTMGLPTMQPMQLQALTGYCQCANAHVEAPLMAQELDAVDAYLNSGFFIE
jgi:hypothetical protein